MRIRLWTRCQYVAMPQDIRANTCGPALFRGQRGTI
jgi:hypothetical protein